MRRVRSGAVEFPWYNAPVTPQPLEVRSVLTRTSGYLSSVCSHSLNPYRGCSYGRSLCGVACYARFQFAVQGRGDWGTFLEVKQRCSELYLLGAPRERRWARRRGRFSIFLASSTDPFVPQERTYRITRQLLNAMLQEPPDELIIQTHSPLILDEIETLQALGQLCELRIHLTIESDRDSLPGLPPPAFSVERRMQAARTLKAAGLRVVVTMAPLHPLADPGGFFRRLTDCADALVIDHFIEGDGSKNGSRTRRTRLPESMEQAQSNSSLLGYRDQVVQWARRHFSGEVGVGCEGFAGRYLERSI